MYARVYISLSIKIFYVTYMLFGDKLNIDAVDVNYIFLEENE